MFFSFCGVRVKSIFSFVACVKCVFSFFCGEPVGTAEGDGVIPEVNAISRGHTQTLAGARGGGDDKDWDAAAGYSILISTNTTTKKKETQSDKKFEGDHSEISTELKRDAMTERC